MITPMIVVIRQCSEDRSIAITLISVLDVPVSERVYDLQGRVVKNPASGIYVVDGKKSSG
jgi:hypothetical protein